MKHLFLPVFFEEAYNESFSESELNLQNFEDGNPTTINKKNLKRSKKNKEDTLQKFSTALSWVILKIYTEDQN